jgi:glucuronate isomerase
MNGFLHDDVLLSGEVARTLYHGVASAAPIVDVHNHLSPSDIAGDRVWATLTDLWLEDDHYKWKAMRLAGFSEQLVTGDADPWDRFAAWAATVPRTIRNPLYAWTHLELRRVFGIDLALNPSTAREIWDEANRQLPNWSAQHLLAHFNVRAVATTDDPSDDLAHHAHHSQHAATFSGKGASASTSSALLPTFRPDAAHLRLIDPTGWNEWADRLGVSAQVAITDLDSLLSALSISYARFASLGCRASDHGLPTLPDRPRDAAIADAAIRKVRAGAVPDADERACVLLEVVSLAARLAHADDSVFQLHLGPLRNASPRLLAAVGRDVGADVMNDQSHAAGLARFLGDLEAANTLPRTVLYNLNPADNALFATMSGAFSRAGVNSLVQWGPPWWFNDHEEGMRRQLDDLSQIGQLGGFIGMLTDSRSILSMTRHELFRRILCDAIGTDVEAGRIPNDTELLTTTVHDICIGNAIQYFGFPNEWAT